jgi:hypothetical protein
MRCALSLLSDHRIHSDERGMSRFVSSDFSEKLWQVLRASGSYRKELDYFTDIIVAKP